MIRASNKLLTALLMGGSAIALATGAQAQDAAADDHQVYCGRDTDRPCGPVADDAAVERSGTAGLNRHVVGRNSSLGETYGLTHEALADLLNAWRKRALEQDAIFTRWPDNA